MFNLIFALLLAILPACPAEDSGTNCGWNATTRGNGIGTSYVVLDTPTGDILIRADGYVTELD